MLGTLVLVYILTTSLFGVYIARKVHTIAGFASANRSLPLPVATATVFATWFGSESILGIPAAFANHGIIGVLSDPIGACLCLIIMGAFFAKTYYNLNVLTIGDFIKHKYGHFAERTISLAIACSYLGWMAAQFMAFGYVMNLITNGILSFNHAIILGALITICYNYNGGMMSVAFNDFIHAIMTILGLIYTLYLVTQGPNSFWSTVHTAITDSSYQFRYDKTYPNIFSVITVVFAMILGTIPQQDTFQRIISSKDAATARASAILGGVVYLAVTIMPVLIMVAVLHDPNQSALLANQPTKELYMLHYIINTIPVFVQVLFLGGVFAAILSSIAGTTLASSVIFSNNVVISMYPHIHKLLAMRTGLVCSVILSASIAAFSTKSIHSLVENSGNATMTIAFAPLVAGLFWKKATKAGAIASSMGGALTWIGLSLYAFITDYNFFIPPALIALIVSVTLMILISLYTYDPSKAVTKK